MARVLVAKQGWGVQFKTSGGFGDRVHVWQQLACSIDTTVYAASTGGTTVSSFTTNDNGELPGWVEEGTYNLTVNGVTTAVSTTSGSVISRMTTAEGDIAALKSGKADVSATLLETTDTAEPRALEVFTTNPFARHERFSVENNQGTEEVDINFRNCTVNFGDPSAAVSMAGSAIFMQPSGGTQSPIQVCKAGGGPLGHKVFQVAAAGAINLGVGGLSSAAIRVNAEGEANDRYWLGEYGEQRWGPGGATALDTDFKRLQAGIMEVGQIGAVGRLQIGYISSVGYIQSRDDAGSTWKALDVAALSINLAPNNTTKLKLDATGIGFYGTTPIAKRAATADATDLASVITLANALKADLQAYGLKT